MRTTKIIYWTATILFSAFMIFSAIPDAILDPKAVEFMTHLGYPEYFIRFIGVAKILGAIAIVIPGFKKIKEWAYAGLVFDLIGAVYSVITVDGFNPGMVIMVFVFLAAGVSYVYSQKVYPAQATA